VSVDAADFDCDQKTDLVTAAYSANNIAWWQNTGNGFSMNPLSDTIIHPNSVYVSKLNNDSFPDIVSVSYSGKLVWWENMGFGVETPEPQLIKIVQFFYQKQKQELVIHSFRSDSLAIVEVYDLSGKLVFATKMPDTTLTLNCISFKPGIYLVTYSGAGVTAGEKIYISN
jgi:hypothetical protein